MPVRNKTIGAAGRDYPSPVLWEADLDDGTNAANDPTPYQAGDDAVGIQYADAVFEINSGININGGGTVGLASITLTVDPASRHGGNFGAGVVIRCTTGMTYAVQYDSADGIPCTLEDFEIDANGQNVNFGLRILRSGAGHGYGFHRLLIHNSQGLDTRAGIYNGSQGGNANPGYVTNCIIRKWNRTGSDARGIWHSGTNRPVRIWCCTVDDVTSNDTAIGIVHGAANSNYECRGCVVTGTGEDYRIGAGGTFDYCSSSDATATGPNSAQNQSAALTFTNAPAGDYTLQPGAAALDGVDLGTSQTVNLDASHRDRIAAGDAWSMGALQFIVGGAPITLMVDPSAHGHRSDTPTLPTVTALTVRDAQHPHLSDEPAFTQAALLAVDASAHPHASDLVTLSTAVSMLVAPARHLHGAEPVDLVQAGALIVADGQHAHGSVELTLTTGLQVEIAPSQHAHSADLVSLAVEGLLGVQDVRQAHASDELALTFAALLEVFDSAHAHGSTVVIILDESVGVAEREGTLVLIEPEPLVVLGPDPIVVIQ